MNKKLLLFIIGLIILAVAGVVIFYNSDSPPINNDFIQSTAQAPAVEGDIINSGIAGRVVLLGGGPYEYEASLEIFKSDNLSTPFISVRTHSDGTFQIPMRPGSYILKPTDPDGPITPARDNYPFTVGNGQWLQVRVEYR